jgi:DNA-binding CsgD family transcriptional regulator
VDPATTTVSSTVKLGALAGRNDADLTWARIEYGGEEETDLRTLYAHGRAGIGIDVETHGQVERSPRMAQVLIPAFDFRDEARLVGSDRHGVWSLVSLFRDRGSAPFTTREIAFLDELAPAMTRGVRTGLLVPPDPTGGGSHHHAAAERERTGGIVPRTVIDRAAADGMDGPAIIVLDARDRVVQVSPAGEAVLHRLATVRGAADPMTSVQALVSTVRHHVPRPVGVLSSYGVLPTAGTSAGADVPPRLRVRTADGTWLLLRASGLPGHGERAGDVVVSIETAGTPALLDLVIAGYGLTDREYEVVSAVLRGLDTRQIAGSLFLSPYTVQDHLKSIFEKVGVSSRRTLVARLQVDQFAARFDAAG